MVAGTPQTEPLIEAWGDWVDPREYLNEDADFAGSTYYPLSRIEDRQEGRCVPYYETELDLARLRGQSRNLAAIDSIAIGAKDARKNYVIGPGYKFRVQDVHVEGVALDLKKRQSPLAQTAQRIVDDFLDANDFLSDLDLELFDRTADDGEPFLWLVPHRGKVLTRLLEPDQITEPRNPRPIEDWIDSTGIQPCHDVVSSWTFGVHTDARFPHIPLGYHVIHDGAGGDWDYVPAGDMLHIKRNVPRNAKRGVSDYYPILADMRNEAKLTTNIVTGAALQAAIPWIEESAPGTTQADIQALGQRLAETTIQRPTANGGTQSRNVQRYRPGTILRPSPGRKYISGPMGTERAMHFIEVAQFMLRRVGVRWTMPEYMISGDASNANFSSTLVAESPFVKAREGDQRFFGSCFYRMIWKVLRIAYRFGAFGPGVSWEQVEHSIDVNVEPPKVSTRDPLAMAQTQEIQMRIGILSKRTAATQAALDYDAEVENGAVEKKPEPIMLPGQFGGDPNSPIKQAAASAALESVTTTDEARAILKTLDKVYP